MKLTLIALTSLISSTVFADGYRCIGNTFSTKLYNEINPKLGTKNPAVLIVSEKGIGTIAKLSKEDIEKTLLDDSIGFSGQTHSTQDGRFISIDLEISKEEIQTEDDTDEPIFAGLITVNSDSLSRTENLICRHYLKN